MKVFGPTKAKENASDEIEFSASADQIRKEAQELAEQMPKSEDATNSFMREVVVDFLRKMGSKHDEERHAEARASKPVLSDFSEVHRLVNLRMVRA